jgi:hypothetical protein
MYSQVNFHNSAIKAYKLVTNVAVRDFHASRILLERKYWSTDR